MIKMLPHYFRRFAFPAACLCLIALNAMPAMATQGHAGIEGVWVHQFAHLFFLFSMGLLIYWLRQAGLVREPGWRYIQYAAVFFMIWNLDAVLVHFLDEQVMAVSVSYTSTWQVQIDAPRQSRLAGIAPTTWRNWTICSAYLAMICLMAGPAPYAAEQTSFGPGRAEKDIAPNDSVTLIPIWIVDVVGLHPDDPVFAFLGFGY